MFIAYGLLYKPPLPFFIPVKCLSKVYKHRLNTGIQETIKPISCILTVYPIDLNKEKYIEAMRTGKMSM